MQVNNRSISVVITCYNYERYVEEAILSVLCQTVLPDEIIVIDDGSTDGSRDVISKYDGQVRSIFQENMGIKITRNRGFAEANGCLIMFLDADDRLCKQAVEFIKKAYVPTAAKIQFDLEIINSEGVRLGRRFCNFGPEESSSKTKKEFDRTGTYSWPVTSGNVYTRAFLSRVMPLMPPVSHDGALNTIAPLYGEIITIPHSMGQYRLHNTNLSRSGGENGIPDFSKRIDGRTQEFKLLRDHAQNVGAIIPSGNLLDNELAFLTYRLIAHKFKQEYVGKDADRSYDLWMKATKMLLEKKGLSLSVFVQITWLTALLFSPVKVAEHLVIMRFNASGVRVALGAMLGRLGRSRIS